MSADAVNDVPVRGEFKATVGNGLTLTEKVLEFVSEPSETRIVMVEVPTWPEAGFTTTERLLPVPLRVIPLFGTRVVLEERPVTCRLAAGVSLSPIVKLRLG